MTETFAATETSEAFDRLAVRRVLLLAVCLASDSD